MRRHDPNLRGSFELTEFMRNRLVWNEARFCFAQEREKNLGGNARYPQLDEKLDGQAGQWEREKTPNSKIIGLKYHTEKNFIDHQEDHLDPK
jgi:hypothetical protein